ncbi:D-alanyl-D-alanine carboxypeptidase family protein [Anaerotardibacter muris]|uniref:D-alanyl-D-alanine carboxypeptidase family protein n=1 Tax=Anaerotardibacter muris TaxID=2941505 RepID=UPI0020407458|nr:D-alanyl-D-alanine carboxypeptidase family protein [Anaerotardibacter muris]
MNTRARYAGILACVFAFIVSLCVLPAAAQAEVRNSDVVLGQTIEAQGFTASQAPNIAAEYAYLISSDGTTYFARNPYEQVHIASITKIMTAVVALEYGGDPSQTEIEVSQAAASIGESSAMLKAGDKLSLESAIKAMMICSGNDAAQAIAESLGGRILEELQRDASIPEDEMPQNGYDAFVYAMNKKALSLGMNDARFSNPHGLDYDQYSGDMHCSAQNVSTMSRAAMENELFRQTVATAKTKIPVQRDGEWIDIELESTDVLLGNYEGACGIKTGFTEMAGECFAGACERDGVTLYAIVLDSTTESQRFADCQALWDWVYNNTVDVPLVTSDEVVTCMLNGNQVEAPVVAHVSHKGWTDTTFRATLANPEETVEVFRYEGNVSQEVIFDDVTSSVRVGDKVGTVNFYQNNEIIKTMDLVAAEDCAGPNFFEGIGIWWSRLTGGASEAASEVVATMPIIYGADAAR